MYKTWNFVHLIGIFRHTGFIFNLFLASLSNLNVTARDTQKSPYFWANHSPEQSLCHTSEASFLLIQNLLIRILKKNS